MSYIRFKRLRKYVNGTPTDEYIKSTERYDLITFDSYFSCSQGFAELTRWVDTPVTECHNNNLCSMQKQQVSYDGGISWSDTGVIQVKDIIEYESRECLSYLEEWRVVQGEYTCENFNKYAIEAEYVSYDSGQSWEPTGQTRTGQMIEPLSTDCNVLYQWVTVEGQFICVGYDKFTLQKEQYSIDSGETWIDSGNERAGTLIEIQSSDCGYEPSYIYQWVIVQNEYVCQGTDKYQKEKEQRSSDGGTTWEDTGNVRAGQLIERQSYDCGYISYRWITDPTTYECVNYDKYEVEKEQQSTDGTNWTDTGRTRTGSLIEHDSTDCGYVPPVPTNIKARLTYLNGDTYDVPLNGNNRLTRTEISRGITSTSDPHYYDKIVSAVITENVELLGYTFQQTTIMEQGPFNYCSNLASVTIPSSVTSIGDLTFYECDSLTSVTIPNSVTSIGNEAFKWSNNIEQIIIPDSVELIGKEVFEGCNGLTSVVIGSSVTSIGEESFKDCTSLTSVVIPNSVTSLGKSAFNQCTGLTSITIGNGVTSIGQHTFSGCNSLATVTIGNSVTSIDYRAFYGCASLTSITIPDSVISIGQESFYNCQGMTSAAIGNGVTSIDNKAFYQCTGLTSLTIGNSVTSIGQYAFNLCRSLTSIVIPDSVRSIGERAFQNCHGFTSVTIGNGITSIATYAFVSCDSLTSFTCEATTPPTLGSNALAETNRCAIYVPSASVQTYKTTSGWSSYSSRIQAIP